MTTATLPFMTLKTPSGFIYDKRRERWELVEEGCQVEGEPVLELASFLLEGEDYVNGQVMRTRSLEMGVVFSRDFSDPCPGTDCVRTHT